MFGGVCRNQRLKAVWLQLENGTRLYTRPWALGPVSTGTNMVQLRNSMLANVKKTRVRSSFITATFDWSSVKMNTCKTLQLIPIAQIFFKRNRNSEVMYKINFHFHSLRHLQLFLFIGYTVTIFVTAPKAIGLPRSSIERRELCYETIKSCTVLSVHINCRRHRACVTGVLR